MLEGRATSTCSLGPLIRAEMAAADSLQGSGVIKWRGSCQLRGVQAPAMGTVVTFAYTVEGETEQQIPKKFRVLSSFADPFAANGEGITTVELGCKLALLEDAKTPEVVQAREDLVLENQDQSELDYSRIGASISASYLVNRCAAGLGVTAAGTMPTNRYRRDTFDLSSGYVNVLSDLLEAECLVGELDEDEVLQIRPLFVASGQGKLINTDNIISIAPVNAGELPGSTVVVKYTGIKLNEPDPDEGFSDDEKINRVFGVEGGLSGLPGVVAGGSGGFSSGPPEGDPEYEGLERSFNTWGVAATVGPNARVYIKAADGTTYQASYTPVTTVTTQYRQISGGNNPGSYVQGQTEKSTSIVSAQNPGYVKALIDSGLGVRDGALTSTTNTFYEYYPDGRLKFQTRVKLESVMTIAGRMNLSYWDGVNLYSPPTTVIASERTNTSYQYSEDAQEVVTSDWVLWPFTQEGQQAAAANSETAGTAAGSADIVAGMISAGLVHRGTTIQYTANPRQPTYKAPDPTDRLNQDNLSGRDNSATSGWGGSLFAPRGGAATLSIVDAGDDLVSGVYENVSFISQTGAGGGLKATMTVESGSVTSAEVTDGGFNYREGDLLLATRFLSAFGGGVTVSVASLADDSDTTPGEDDQDDALPVTEETRTVLVYGNGLDPLQKVFTLTYAPDDFIGGTSGSYFIIRSDADIKARRYGAVRNQLLFGARYGLRLQASPLGMPSMAFDPLYVDLAGVMGQFRLNNLGWVLEPGEVVCGCNALYWGTIGTTPYTGPAGGGGSWVPLPPGAENPGDLPEAPAPTAVPGTGSVVTVEDDADVLPPWTAAQVYGMTCYRGVFRVSGRAAATRASVDYELAAGRGAFFLQGRAAGTDYENTPDYVLEAEAGVFDVSGEDAGLDYSLPINEDATALLHFDDTGGGAFVNTGTLASVTTLANEGVVLDDADPKFGTDAGAFVKDDQAHVYLSTDPSDLLLPEEEDFTIDAWCAPYAIPVTGVLGVAGLTSFADTNVVSLAIVDGAWQALVQDEFLFGPAAVEGEWVHVAITREGTTVRLFVNGVLVDSGTAASVYNYEGGGIYIGALQGTGSAFFNGYIDEFRYVKGAAIWTSNFTPPTAAYDDP